MHLSLFNVRDYDDKFYIGDELIIMWLDVKKKTILQHQCEIKNYFLIINIMWIK